MKKKNEEPVRSWKVGDEFIYHNGKDIMTKVRIEEILPNGYLLSNQVRMNDNLKRMDEKADRYPHYILPLTERTQLMYDAHNAFYNLQRLIGDLDREMRQLDKFNLTVEQSEKYIRILKKLKKAIEK